MKIQTATHILKEISNKPLPLLQFNEGGVQDPVVQEVTVTAECHSYNEADKSLPLLHETVYGKLKQGLLTFATNELQAFTANYCKVSASDGLSQSLHEDNYAGRSKADIENINHSSAADIICRRRSLPYNLRSRCNKISCSSVCHDSDGFKVPTCLPTKKSHKEYRRHQTKTVPRTPRLRQQIEYFMSPSQKNLRTPVALTPFLMTLMRESPISQVPDFPKDVLSTPVIMEATRPPVGVPDFLSIIDDDSVDCSGIDCKLSTFNEASLADNNVTDYILAVTDDYVQNQNKQVIDCTIKPKSQKLMQERGQHCKKLPEHMEEVIKKHQKEKCKTKVKKRKNINQENTEEFIKRRVQSCGRRTRSLLKAAEKFGLTVNDANILDRNEEE